MACRISKSHLSRLVRSRPRNCSCQQGRCLMSPTITPPFGTAHRDYAHHDSAKFEIQKGRRGDSLFVSGGSSSPCRRAFSTAVEHRPLEDRPLKGQSQPEPAAPSTTGYHYPPDILAQLDMDPETLHTLASQRPTPLSLADMYKYASSVSKDQRLYNAQFLHKELAIRIAHRTVDLLTLPLGLSEAEPIRQVARLYLHYLKQLQETPLPTTPEQEDAFTRLLQSMVLDRSTIPTQIAKGVRDWNLQTSRLAQDSAGSYHVSSLNGASRGSFKHNEDISNELERRQEVLEQALYRFFTARVGLRFLIEHHIVSSRTSGLDYRKLMNKVFPRAKGESGDASTELHSTPAPSGDEISAAGCIQSNVDVVQETRTVAALVKEQILRSYGCCPDIQIVDCIHPRQQQQQAEKKTSAVKSKNRKQAAGFTYVPHHLHYMLAELLVNACRATVLHHRAGAYAAESGIARTSPATPLGSLNAESAIHSDGMPPIRVVLVMGKEDITIKVCDKGGGIPRSLMGKIWKFGHSTDTASDDAGILPSTDGHGTEEVAGAHIRGFGLPLARIYARYFGGELNLKSLEGHGVDAYLHLPRLGEAGENLPLRVRSSPGELDSIPRDYR